MRRMFFEHESHELHESQYFIGTRIVTDYHAGDKSNEPKERSVKICGICGKIKEEQDERVPVHDGVSLSFAVVSLGCHRNTPDCTLPCLQMLLLVYCVILSSSGIGSGILAGWCGSSCRTVIGWVLGAAALYGIHTLDSSVKVSGHQLASGSGTELQADDELRHAEVLLGVGSAFHLQTDGEDGKVGELDVLAEKEKFLGADYGIGQDALDGSLAERSVVARHVLCQLVETDGLLCCYSRIPLLVSLTVLVVVLIQ